MSDEIQGDGGEADPTVARTGRRLLELAENIDAVFWLRDLESGRLLYINPAYETIWGRSRQELRSDPRSWREAVHPDDLPRVERALAEDSLRPYDIRYRVIRPDGSLRWVRDRSVFVREEEGKIVRLAGIAEDVTPFVEAEAALRESEERFRQLAEHLTVSVWIFTADFSRTLYLNPVSAQIWGVPLQEGYEDPNAFLKRVHPDDRAALEAAIARGAESEVQVRADVGGELRRLRIRGVPVPDEDGEPYRVVGITEDFTERVRIEEELSDSREHYRRLVETSPDAIYALDGEGRFTEVNRATEALLSRSAGELVGQHYHLIVHPDDRDRADEAFTALRRNPSARLDIELRVLGGDGGTRILSLAIVGIDHDGTATGVQGIGRDVTEERMREEHLRRAERFASMGTLISGVAHELNNPLQAIAGFAELLLSDPHDPEQAEALETISREARRASRIVADLKLLARRSSEPMEVRTSVDVGDIVRHIARTREYANRNRDIDLRLDLAPTLPTVYGDPSRIEQILLNLVVNAEQALRDTPEPRIIVRTRPTARGVTLTVEDNGSGIPREIMSSIFDPFFTTKSPQQGTGLGLSLVHSMVQEHGGSVHVESEAGRGASFQVHLPAGGHVRQAGAEAREESAAAAPPRRRSVLVVDDEPSIRSLVRRAANRHGHSVDEAAEGSEALEWMRSAEAASAPYDIVLCDLRMEGVGGAELLRRVAERFPQYLETIVILTGDPSHPEAARLADQYGVLIVQKPLDLTELIRLIDGDPDRPSAD